MKHSLRDTYVHRIFGERVFHHDIWALNINSLAGGLSLGLFIAFTPTIPFHMLLCTLGALLLRVNLPIALAVSWVVNPITALPVFLSARRIGHYFFDNFTIGQIALDWFSFESRTGKFMEASLYLWTGSLFFSIVSAFLVSGAVRLAWRLGPWYKNRTREVNTNSND